ncbi:MAG: HTTM domain-containing protein [Planctomycetaceae bacterium]
MSMEESTAPSSRIGRFFFREEYPFGLAILRIVLPVILLLLIIPRWTHSREFYSSDGAVAPLADDYGYRNFLPEPTGTMAVAMTTALLFCLSTASLGWRTRLSLAVSTVLYAYLNLLDTLSSMTKYSVIATHMLLLLTVSDCGALWSIDAWCKRRKGVLPRKSPVWPRRLMQLLVAVIYFGAAFTKMHDSGFFNSDSLRTWMWSNVNNTNTLGEYLALYPVALIVMAHICSIWETLFIFLCWRGPSRTWMIAVGIGFHMATVPMLGLVIFPMVMIASYLSFVEPEMAERWLPRLRSLWRLAAPKSGLQHAKLHSTQTVFRMPALMLFLIALSLTLVSGIEIEHLLDPYGKRGPNGPFKLAEIEPAEAKRMLAPSTRLREKDKLLAFEVGTNVAGGVILRDRRVFSVGDSLFAQCTLNPPHEDMWIECNLLDDRGRTVERQGQFVLRDQNRTGYFYPITELWEPGSYSLVVISGGREIGRRSITVLGDDLRPVAN